MARRSYAQYCPLALALDVIGDRWALLVVRELLLGPARYTDLARGLPGIATDMLTRRLRELEQAGILERRDQAPPAGASVYALTERGEQLREPLMALARWGLELMPLPDEDVDFTPALVANALNMFVRPGARDRLEAALSIGGEEFVLRVRGGSVRVTRGRAAAPQLTLRGEPWPVAAALIGGAPPEHVEVGGDAGALERLRAMIVPPPALAAA